MMRRARQSLMFKRMPRKSRPAVELCALGAAALVSPGCGSGTLQWNCDMTANEQREFALTQFRPFQTQSEVERALSRIGLNWTSDIDPSSEERAFRPIRPLGTPKLEVYIGTVLVALRTGNHVRFYFDSDDRLTEVFAFGVIDRWPNPTAEKIPMFRLVP